VKDKPKKMSRKDEIVGVMKNNEQSGEASFGPYFAVFEDSYETVATEIEKIFEGEVDYVLQKHVDMYGWADSSSGWKEEAVLSKIKKGEIRAVKRITIDQIIEE
jgi:hypothetical protein